MTKETKIGLLVGLAFIILFAVILSEKGTESRDSARPSFAIADGANDETALQPEEQPLDGIGRLPIRDRLDTTPALTPATLDDDRGTTMIASNTNDSRRGPLGQPIPGEDEELPPLPRSFVELLNQSMPQEPAQQPLATASRDEATISIEDAIAGAIAPLDTEPPAEPQDDLDRQALIPIETRSLQANAHKLAQANQAAREAEEIAAPITSIDGASATNASPTAKVKVSVLAKHVVQPGESLGKIAARYYGRATPERIEAIFLANRDVLSDINKVKANDELRIPRLDGSLPSSFEPAPGFVGTQVADARQPINRPEQVRIPLPVGDQSRPKGTQRNEPASRRAVSPAERQPVRTASHTDKPSFTWYEVKERDTLSLIAKRLLGNDRRYLEIYRMNRDRLPNMNALKPGQKIRVPLRSPRAENEDEVRSASAISIDML